MTNRAASFWDLIGISESSRDSNSSHKGRIEASSVQFYSLLMYDLTSCIDYLAVQNLCFERLTANNREKVIRELTY